jgi:hypothetical protein
VAAGEPERQGGQTAEKPSASVVIVHTNPSGDPEPNEVEVHQSLRPPPDNRITSSEQSIAA